MPDGKPAGIPCINLDENFRCRIHGDPDYPAVCAALRPDSEMCGSDRQDALGFLTELERRTCPLG